MTPPAKSPTPWWCWITTALTTGDTLPLPDIGIEIPVAEFFAGTDLAEASAS